MKGQIEAAARGMKKMGINFELHFETWSSYFPPYLYGEPLPTTTCVYDGGWNEAATDPHLGLWSQLED